MTSTQVMHTARTRIYTADLAKCIDLANKVLQGTIAAINRELRTVALCDEKGLCVIELQQELFDSLDLAPGVRVGFVCSSTCKLSVYPTCIVLLGPGAKGGKTKNQEPVPAEQISDSSLAVPPPKGMVHLYAYASYKSPDEIYVFDDNATGFAVKLWNTATTELPLPCRVLICNAVVRDPKVQPSRFFVSCEKQHGSRLFVFPCRFRPGMSLQPIVHTDMPPVALINTYAEFAAAEVGSLVTVVNVLVTEVKTSEVTIKLSKEKKSVQHVRFLFPGAVQNEVQVSIWNTALFNAATPGSHVTFKFFTRGTYEQKPNISSNPAAEIVVTRPTQQNAVQVFVPAPMEDMDEMEITDIEPTAKKPRGETTSPLGSTNSSGTARQGTPETWAMDGFTLETPPPKANPTTGDRSRH
jgi:hypothetical protein